MCDDVINEKKTIKNKKKRNIKLTLIMRNNGNKIFVTKYHNETNKQARIAADLIELRNKSVFAFFMANALFVLIVFLLQLNKDKLHIVWPLGVKTNITYIEETSEVLICCIFLQRSMQMCFCFVNFTLFLTVVMVLL